MKKILGITLLSSVLFVGCHHDMSVPKEYIAHMRLAQEATNTVHRLDIIAQEEHITEIERDEFRLEKAQNLVVLLDNLVESLKKQKNQKFATYIQLLEKRTKALERSVKQGNSGIVSEHVQAVELVCSACHTANRAY